MGGVTISGGPARPAQATVPARPASGRRWLLVATLVWAAGVLGVAIWGADHGKPTAREQTTIAQALPVVDTAIADAVTAAGAADTVPAITGYTRLDTACRVTGARSGSRYERAALIYTAPGTEPAVLDRIAAALPAGYRARVRHTGPVHTLTADAGEFVAVRGTVSAPGVVRIAADTGCRPQDRPVAEGEPASATANRAPVEAVFATLGATPGDWRVHRLSCRGGGTLWTVEATGGPNSSPGALTAVLRQAPAVVARSDLYAYRSGPVGVAVRTVDGALDVTATTGCA